MSNLKLNITQILLLELEVYNCIEEGLRPFCMSDLQAVISTFKFLHSDWFKTYS